MCCHNSHFRKENRKIEHLLDVLGEPETYFLPSVWKLENHQRKFSSRLPLRNIHHLPVRSGAGRKTVAVF